MQPQYSASVKVWAKMRDTLAGEEVMKDKVFSQNSNFKGCNSSTAITNLNQYLRMAEGLRSIGDVGWGRFTDYVFRSMYYPFPLTIKNQSLGMINGKEPTIELPTQFEYLRKDATQMQEPLVSVLSSVNDEQLSVGRIGIMLETTIDTAKPFNIISYVAESIFDWEYNTKHGEQFATWVKLKEVISVRTGGSFSNEDQYRILALDDKGDYFQYVTDDSDVSPEDARLVDEDKRLYPTVITSKGETKSKRIPFIVCNVNSLGFNVERPPLEGVSDSSIKLFQGDAEYRDILHWGGVATFITTGLSSDESSKITIGNGQHNNISSADGKAFYVSAGVDAVAPNKDNVESLKIYCASLGVDLLNQGVESGDALNARINVKTSPLKTLSKTGAYGLETLLQIGAEWMSLNIDDVKITGNIEFGEKIYTADDLVKLSMLVDGGKMSKQAYFNLLSSQKLTSEDTLDDEDLQVEIELNQETTI